MIQLFVTLSCKVIYLICECSHPSKNVLKVVRKLICLDVVLNYVLVFFLCRFLLINQELLVNTGLVKNLYILISLLNERLSDDVLVPDKALDFDLFALSWEFTEDLLNESSFKRPCFNLSHCNVSKLAFAAAGHVIVSNVTSCIHDLWKFDEELLIDAGQRVANSNLSFEDEVHFWSSLLFFKDNLSLLKDSWLEPEADLLKKGRVSILVRVEEASELKEDIVIKVLDCRWKSLHKLIVLSDRAYSVVLPEEVKVILYLLLKILRKFLVLCEVA